MPSKLDPHVAAIKDWLAAEPQLTAIAIVGRLSEKHPDQFGTKQHSIVQRLLKALRKKAAEQLFAQESLGTAAVVPAPDGLPEDTEVVGALDWTIVDCVPDCFPPLPEWTAKTPTAAIIAITTIIPIISIVLDPPDAAAAAGAAGAIVMSSAINTPFMNAFASNILKGLALLQIKRF